MRISDWSSDVCSSDLAGRGISDLQTLIDAALGGIARTRRGIEEEIVADVIFELQNAEDVAQRRIVPVLTIVGTCLGRVGHCGRSEEHTSELQSLMRISYAVFCLKKKTKQTDRS